MFKRLLATRPGRKCALCQAANDSADADTGVSVVIDVLENDQGLDDDPVNVEIHSSPGVGSVVAFADTQIESVAIAGEILLARLAGPATEEGRDFAIASAAFRWLYAIDTWHPTRCR